MIPGISPDVVIMTRTELEHHSLTAFQRGCDRQGSEVERLKVALEQCADRFAEYAESHEAKGTTDAAAKAARNREMVTMINRTLERCPL